MNITLSSITKKFGALTALNSVSATFEAGRIYIVVGPNGAGKTTLLRIVSGLLRPTSGKVAFIESGTHALTHSHTRALNLGVMMQESYLYRDLTPRENLELYAKLYDASDAQRKKVVDLLDLNDFLDHEVDTLSHGQKQRVSFARALLPNPNILILDEPFLGLDTASVSHVQNYLDHFKKTDRLAIIATHELDLVRSLADEMLLLEAGTVKYFGKFNM